MAETPITKEIALERLEGLELRPERKIGLIRFFNLAQEAFKENPKVNDFGREALKRGLKVARLRERKQPKERIYKEKMALQKTCGKLVEVLDPHLPVTPSRKLMAKAAEQLALAIQEQKRTVGKVEVVEVTEVMKAVPDWQKVINGALLRLGISWERWKPKGLKQALRPVALTILLAFGTACARKAKLGIPEAEEQIPGAEIPGIEEQLKRISPIPIPDKEQIPGLIEQAISRIPKGQIPGGLGEDLKDMLEFQLGYYTNPEARRAFGEKELINYYIQEFNEEKTSVSPWQTEFDNVMVLTALSGPGWWAKIPRFKSHLEQLVERPLSNEEWEKYTTDRDAALALLRELREEGKITEEVYQFYASPSEELKKKIEEKYPGLLPK